MQEQFTQLLEKLAIQLGTTVDKLQDVLIQQAAVQAEISTIWMWVGIIVFSILTILSIIMFLIGISNEEPGTIVGSIALWVFIGGIVALLTTEAYTTLITLQQNPEYWALQQILEAFK